MILISTILWDGVGLVKAYSYIRISSEQQKLGGGEERQLKLTREYCLKHNLKLVEEMRDLAISSFRGKNETEGVLGQFLNAVRSGEIETPCYLICESLDRISRQNPVKAYSLFSAIITSGVTIATLIDDEVLTEEVLEKNPSLLFVTLAKFIRANDESAHKSKRALEYFQKVLAKEKLHAGIAPKWLKKSNDGKKWEFNNNLSTIKLIIKLYLYGDKISDNNPVGTQMIAKLLNRNDVKRLREGGLWNKTTIAKILKNRALYGAHKPKHNGEYLDVIEDFYPAIISENEYKKIQYKLESNKTYKKGVKTSTENESGSTNIFQGLMKCEYCGNPIYYERARASKKYYKYLICLNVQQNKKIPVEDYINNDNQIGCILPRLPYRANEVKILLNLQKHFGSILKSENTTLEQKKTEIKECDTKIDEYTREINKYQELFRDLLIDELPKFKNELQLLIKKKKETEEKRDEAYRYLSNDNHKLDDFGEAALGSILFLNNSKDETREILQSFIKKIDVGLDVIRVEAKNGYVFEVLTQTKYDKIKVDFNSKYIDISKIENPEFTEDIFVEIIKEKIITDEDWEKDFGYTLPKIKEIS